MASTSSSGSSSPELLKDGVCEVEESNVTLLDLFREGAREKIILQRLLVAGLLHGHAADRKEHMMEVATHFEKLHLQLRREYMFDRVTGLLLIFPTCLLHIIESSRDVLLSVLRNMKHLEERPDSRLLEASKVVLLEHDPQRRTFQQWSYKMMDVEQRPQDTGDELEEEEESTESLVCTVLAALKKLDEHLQESGDALPGTVLDEVQHLCVPPEVIHQLLERDMLLSVQEHLELYDSPIVIDLDAGLGPLSLSDNII